MTGISSIIKEIEQYFLNLSQKGIMGEKIVLVSKPFSTHMLSTKIREVLDN